MGHASLKSTLLSPIGGNWVYLTLANLSIEIG